jgi:hypothetical protein
MNYRGDQRERARSSSMPHDDQRGRAPSLRARSATPSLRPDLAALLSSARVALLLIGEAFRSGLGRGSADDLPCNASSMSDQWSAAKSYRRNVIEPLVAHGATVDVLFTFPRCPVANDSHHLMLQVRQWFEPHVVAQRLVRSSDLGDGWRHGYRLLRAHYGDNPPDFVLQARVRAPARRPPPAAWRHSARCKFRPHG